MLKALHIHVGLFTYAMVGSIPHAVAFGMCHLVCKGDSTQTNVILFIDYVVCFFKTTEIFNL